MNKIDKDDFARYIAETMEQQKTIAAGAYVDEVLAMFHEVGQASPGQMPWGKAYGLFACRPGEVTLWGGFNGHGKSALTGQVAIGFLAQNEPCCIASFEMLPAASIKRLVRQMTCGPTPTDTAVRESVGWLDDHKLWFFDHQGSVDVGMIEKLASYCKERLGVRHLFVDSLMKCVRNEDDFNGQKFFVDRMCDLARHLGLHIHLIHHSRKGANEDTPPGKMDMKGSGSITDQVDNVVSVWKRPQPNDNEPDALMLVSKQRHGDWTGSLGLWCHAPSLQFVSDFSRRPIDLRGGIGQ